MRPHCREHRKEISMPNELLAELQGRIKRFLGEEDRDAVLSPEALELAGAVRESLPDPVDDLEALHTLGWFYWCVHLALPEEDNPARAVALKLLEPLCYVAPDAVPEQVRRYSPAPIR
jgi:hypothetical protein